MKRVAVIGAGLAGLTCAYRLMKRGLRVTVFEAEGRSGGVIRSEHHGDHLIEGGPHTLVVGHDQVRDLIEELQIAHRVTPASPLLKKRYIVLRGEPVAAPSSLPGFLRSPILSAKGKLRVAAECFVPRGRDGLESVRDFAVRRFGGEAADRFFDPLVSGIYAGDPSFLCTASSLPKIFALEQSYGSVLAGMIAGGSRARRAGEIPRSRAQVISFDNGLSVLTDSLASELGPRLILQTPIESIEYSNGGWCISRKGADGPALENRFDHLVCALPAHRLGLVFPPFKALQDAMPPYASVGSLSLVYKRSAVRHPLDGFGALIPACEKHFLLGVIFTSSIFPQRTKSDEVLLTALFGGARHPDRVQLDREEIMREAHHDLSRLFGISAPPTFHRLTRWAEGIPQFGSRHPEFLQRLRQLEESYRGLHIIGNFVGGVSLSDVVTYALAKSLAIHS